MRNTQQNTWAAPIRAACLSAFLLAGGRADGGADAAREQSFKGMADASAAIAIDTNRFLIASDEDNILRLYSVARPGMPVQVFPWDAALRLPDQDHIECDIEGAAMVSNRIYWIGSHGRNRDGVWRANRTRFFATDISTNGASVRLTAVGLPYTNLVAALLAEPALSRLGLREAVGNPSVRRKELAPKKQGLNIEGLAAIPGSEGLLIGFRNPCPDGKALLVPLQNPGPVILASASPVFGPPVLLDLQGLGIRDIAYSAQHGGYLIVAGSRDGRNDRFAVFTWSGQPDARPEPANTTGDWADFKPEAVVVFPATLPALLISDDGARAPQEGVPADRMKDLPSPLTQSFRARWFDISP